MSGFIAVTDEAALEQLFAPWQQELLVLFLHDPYCFTSIEAEGEMADLAEPVYLLDVAAARSLSRRVMERTGIRHESPQAFVLQAGHVRWSGSHGSVTADAVRQALRRCATPATPSPGSLAS